MSSLVTDYLRDNTKDIPSYTHTFNDSYSRQCKDCSTELPDEFEEWKILCRECYYEKKEKDNCSIKQYHHTTKGFLLNRTPEKRSCIDCKKIFQTDESWKMRCLACYLRSKGK